MIHNLQKSAKETHFDKNISGLHSDSVQGAIDDVVRTIGYVKSKNLLCLDNAKGASGAEIVTRSGDSLTIKANLLLSIYLCEFGTHKLKKGTYILSCKSTNYISDGSKCGWRIYSDGAWGEIAYSDTYEFTLDSDKEINIAYYLSVNNHVSVGASVTLTELMLREASKNDTYEPYVPNIEDILYFKKGETLSISDVVLCTGVMAHNGCIYFSIPMPKNLKNISTISMSCSKMFIRSVIGEKTLTNFSGYAFTFYPENNVLSAEIRDVTSLGITKGTPVAIAGVFNFTFN